MGASKREFEELRQSETNENQGIPMEWTAPNTSKKSSIQDAISLLTAFQYACELGFVIFKNEDDITYIPKVIEMLEAIK